MLQKIKNIAFKPLLFVIVTSFFLNACTDRVVKPQPIIGHIPPKEINLYDLKKWSFDGRLALSDGKDSWSASIDWVHSEKKDVLKLSGPLGQGAIIITLNPYFVILDRGEGADKIQQSSDIDTFIKDQLGIFVPVQSLRYWVLGLTAPKKKFVKLSDGFEQEKWIVQYSEMQQEKQYKVPRKLKAHLGKTRLKLIVDTWKLP